MKNIKLSIIGCLESEAKAILDVVSSLNEDSERFVKKIAQCKGKIFFTGVGKSYIVASKIAATFSSLGISSIAINPLFMLHGDLGQLSKDDFFVVISNSGETDVLLDVINAIHKLGIIVLSITGNRSSTIAKLSNEHIEIKVDEAGPFGIVPTSSTTAVMAMGDALACALCYMKSITIDDFKRFHPSGELSK